MNLFSVCLFVFFFFFLWLCFVSSMWRTTKWLLSRHSFFCNVNQSLVSQAWLWTSLVARRHARQDYQSYSYDWKCCTATSWFWMKHKGIVHKTFYLIVLNFPFSHFFFQDCLPQILFGLFLNTLSHITYIKDKDAFLMVIKLTITIIKKL